MLSHDNVTWTAQMAVNIHKWEQRSVIRTALFYGQNLSKNCNFIKILQTKITIYLIFFYWEICSLIFTELVGASYCPGKKLCSQQGWEFAHLISEQIACFLSKNERMSHSLKKISDSLIHSFLVSEMSNSLTSLISSERPEQITHGRSFLVSEMIDSLTSLI